MDDEAIRAEQAKDVSEAVDHEATSQQVDGSEAQEESNPGSPEDPVTRRERMMKEAQEKAKEQRESDRRSAALINDPDMTEEEYDARMAERRREQIEAQRQELERENAELGPAEAETPASDMTTGSDDGDQEPQEGWITKDDGSRVKRLRVNGEMRELTEEQYDRAVSKSIAGDQKLELANRVMQQAKEREERIAQQEAALRQKPSEPDVSIDEIKAQLDEYQEAFMEGDTDVARDRLAEILMKARGTTSTPDLNALADEAATRVNERIQAERNRESVQKGWDSFREQYPQIVNDPENLEIADVVLKRVRQENPGLTPAEQIAMTGERVAKRLKLQSVPAAEKEQASNPTDGRAVREQRKSNLQPIPKAGGRVHKADEGKKVDMSPEAKIRRMRASRAVS